MKTLTYSFKGITSDMRLLLIIICLIIIASCNLNNEDPVPVASDISTDISDTHAKKINIPNGIIDLEGVVHFRLYLVKTNEWLMPPGSVPATATLEHIEGKNYIFRLSEFGRETPFITTMTPSGVVECEFPVPFDCYDPFDLTLFDNPVDQLEYTTGFGLRGPGINKNTLIYKGKFDGKKLEASTHFMGLQEKFGTFPVYQQVIEGPLQFEFVWEMTVVDN
jgi:hypothetical protein